MKEFAFKEIVNMVLVTKIELGSGLILQLGNLDHYVIEIVAR